MPGIKKNVIFLGLSGGVGILGELAVVVLTARYLGVYRFGQQSVLRATAMFALPLFAGGLNVHIIREIARDPDGVADYLGSVLTLRWVLGLGAALAAALIVRLLPLSPSLELASDAAILLGLSGIWAAVPRAVLVAYERNEYNLLMGGVTSLLSIALTVVAIRLDAGVAGTLAAVAVSTFVVTGVAQLLLRRYLVRPRLRVNLARWRGILRSVLPLGIGGVLQRSYSRIDVWLLAALAGAREAALFSVAYRVTLQVTDVTRLLSTALLPRVSHLAKARLEDLRTATECLLRLLLIASIAGAGLAAACAAPLLLLIAGPKFAGSVAALRLVSVVCVTSLPNAILLLVLVALGKERSAVKAGAITVVWNALIDTLLIPRFGVLGACYGTISAEWVCFAMVLYLVQKELRIPGLWPLFAKLLLPGVAMAVAIGMAGADRPGLGVVAGGAVFGMSCLLLRVVPRGTLRRLRRALRARPAEAPATVDALAEATTGAD